MHQASNLYIQRQTFLATIQLPVLLKYCLAVQIWLGKLSKTAKDSNVNGSKTIRLITQDKRRTWICEIKMTFVPSCSQMRLQLLHFHTVFKTWPTFQELTSIVSFRRRRWSQRNFSENRNIQGNQSKDMLSRIGGLWRNIFETSLPTLVLASSFQHLLGFMLSTCRSIWYIFNFM